MSIMYERSKLVINIKIEEVHGGFYASAFGYREFGPTKKLAIEFLLNYLETKSK